MLPQDAVIKYWLRVRELLRSGSVTDQQADRGIRDYVALAEAHGFTEAIYHRNEDEIAEIIKYGIENESFPEPAKA
jgi:hypothetical protein